MSLLCCCILFQPCTSLKVANVPGKYYDIVTDYNCLLKKVEIESRAHSAKTLKQIFPNNFTCETLTSKIMLHDLHKTTIL